MDDEDLTISSFMWITDFTTCSISRTFSTFPLFVPVWAIHLTSRLDVFGLMVLSYSLCPTSFIHSVTGSGSTSRRRRIWWSSVDLNSVHASNGRKSSEVPLPFMVPLFAVLSFFLFKLCLHPRPSNPASKPISRNVLCSHAHYSVRSPFLRVHPCT